VTPPQTHDSARPDTTLRPVSAAAVDSSKALEQFRSMGGASRECRFPDTRTSAPRVAFDVIHRAGSTRTLRRDRHDAIRRVASPDEAVASRRRVGFDRARRSYLKGRVCFSPARP
jgi:hypothetical protein